MIAVERFARKDIRASAQGLIVFATNGLGMLFGSLLAGQVASYFLTPQGHQWARIFMVPISITIVAAIAFVALFSERRFKEEAHRVELEAKQPATA